MDKAFAAIKPVAPFNFDLTAGYHTYFQGRYGTDSLADGVYRRLLDLGNKLVLASATSTGSVDEPGISLEVEGESLTDQEVTKARQQMEWLLGTGQDPAGFYRLAKQDATMSRIVDEFYGLHLPHTPSVFEALVLAILGQQIATNVARIIRTLLIETYGPHADFGGNTYYAFPRPEALGAASVEELRGMKLSQRKAEYVQGIALAALDGSGGFDRLPELDDQEVVQRVQALRGVGQWTAQWILIRALGRSDAFPLGDLALRRAVSRLYYGGEELSEDELERFSWRWSPYRTYATVYIFTALRGGMA